MQGRYRGEGGRGPEEQGDLGGDQGSAGPAQYGGDHRHAGEHTHQGGAQALVGQLAANDVAQGQADADQQQGPGHAPRRNAGDIAEQRCDVGEQGKHRGREQHGHRQRQPDSSALERRQFGAHVEFFLVMAKRQETDQADQGDDTDHRHCPEGRTPAVLLTQRSAQRYTEHVGQGQAGEHQGHRRGTAIGRHQAGGNHRTDAEEGAVTQGGDHPGEHQQVVVAGHRTQQVADDEHAHQRDQGGFARQL
ncbi:hypothetical protein D3C76_1000820 [compost metagenome]